jgi:hypothetical protein
MSLAEVAAELLFQVIAERAEKAALIVTTNLPFSEWPQVFTNARLCKAVLDRLTDQAHIIETGSESYRFRRTLRKKRQGDRGGVVAPLCFRFSVGFLCEDPGLAESCAIRGVLRESIPARI